MSLLEDVGVAFGIVRRASGASELLLASRVLGLAQAPRLGVSSGAFSYGECIPATYARDGASPPLSWRGVLPATRELVLICEDEDASLPQPRTHWLLYGIRPEVRILPEKSSSFGTPGLNDAGVEGYHAPKPPRGGPAHRYHFQVFAMAKALRLPPRARQEDLLRAMQGNVLAWGEVVGTYARRTTSEPPH